MTRRDLLVALAAAGLTLGVTYAIGVTKTLDVTYGAEAPVPIMGTSIFRWDETEAKERGEVRERVFASDATSTLLNLEVRGVTVAPGQTPHPARPRAQTEEQLVLVRRGSLRVELGRIRPTTAGGVDDTTQTLGPGDVLFLAPNQEHALRSVGTRRLVYYAVEWRSPGMQGGKEPLTSQP